MYLSYMQDTMPVLISYLLPVLTPFPCRTLVPQLNNFSKDSIHDFLTQIAQENRLLSWKEMMYLLHDSPQQLCSKTPITSVSMARGGASCRGVARGGAGCRGVARGGACCRVVGKGRG